MRRPRVLDFDNPATFEQQRPHFRAALLSLHRFRADCETLRDFAAGHDPGLVADLDGVLWWLRTVEAMIGGQSPPCTRPLTLH